MAGQNGKSPAGLPDPEAATCSRMSQHIEWHAQTNGSSICYLGNTGLRPPCIPNYYKALHVPASFPKVPGLPPPWSPGPQGNQDAQQPA